MKDREHLEEVNKQIPRRSSLAYCLRVSRSWERREKPREIVIWGDGANDLHVLEAPNCPIKIVKDRSGCLRINELIGIKHTKCSLINKIFQHKLLLSVLLQFSSVTQSCLTLCDPMDCSTPGLPVHHKSPEFTQTHVHWVSDAIHPSHPLLSPSPAFNTS